MWVAEYEGKQPLKDSGGFLTGEYRLSYGKPFEVFPTVSPRRGNSWNDGFGVGVDCDRTAVIDEVGTGITDTCVLWVDSAPALDADGSLALDADGSMRTPFDYSVAMVAESYSFTSIAMKKAM